MKSPITGKEMKLIVEDKHLLFRKEKFKYAHQSYYCEDSNEFFTDTYLDTLNINQVYNQYREKYNVPFPEEIQEIRDKYGLSGVKMSKVLGFGVNSYTQYEKGEIPSVSNGKLIMLAQDPKQFRKLVEESTDIFNASQQEEIIKKVDRLIREDEHNRFKFQLKNYLLGDRNPDIYTGYKIPRLEKISEMVFYFAQRLQPGTTVLNKLLFYSDFLNYKRTAYSISGSRYRAIDYGPVPIKYDSIFEHISENNLVCIVHVDYGKGVVGKEFRPTPGREFNAELFSPAELQSMESVVSFFKGKSRKEIVRFSHEEKAWEINYKNGKDLIPYDYGFYLNDI